MCAASLAQSLSHLGQLQSLCGVDALERLFREFRAKTDDIGAFPNEDCCLTLFFLVIQRDHAKHDRLKTVAKNSGH